MITHLKKGDLVYCQIINYDDIRQDKHRPCLVLEVITEGILVLPITNSKGDDKIDVTVISCCKALSGFVSLVPESTAISYCKLDEICNCKVSWKLGLILDSYNIKY